MSEEKKTIAKKTKKKRRFDAITFLKKRSVASIGLALCVTYLFASVVYSSMQILELKKQEAVLEIQIKEQETIAKGLENEILYLQTNVAVEKIAREELGLVKPGEILILPKN